ncbi:hypothetical protein FKM82_025821 [Ascaphus truei]
MLPDGFLCQCAPQLLQLVTRHLLSHRGQSVTSCMGERYKEQRCTDFKYTIYCQQNDVTFRPHYRDFIRVLPSRSVLPNAVL